MKYCQLEKISISKKDPYYGDSLNRSQSGEILLKLVKSFPDGFVMAVNGKWGTGKTTFIEMWKQQMQNEGYETIYYNVWENDYISDPLIGLIAEFKKKNAAGGDKLIEKCTQVISKISFSMIPSLLAIMVKQFTGMSLEDLDKVIKDGSKEAMALLDKSVDNYIEQQNSIKEFRKALEEYVSGFDKPIIFIIDELDRCKPDFAVKTLERIKHLFSVKNVVFVLAIDKEQLGNSIRGYYGSDLIDADDYLRRFIDVPYDLPAGNALNMVKRVFNRFGFNKAIPKSKQSSATINELQFLVLWVYTSKNLSIRQLEKWMLHTRLVISQLSKSGISVETTAFLVFLYTFDAEFYNHLIHYGFSDQEILDRFIDFFPQSSIYTESFDFYRILAEVFNMKYFDNETKFHERVMTQNGQLLLITDSVVSEKLRNAFNDIKAKLIPLISINDLFCNFSPED